MNPSPVSGHFCISMNLSGRGDGHISGLDKGRATWYVDVYSVYLAPSRLASRKLQLATMGIVLGIGMEAKSAEFFEPTTPKKHFFVASRGLGVTD